MNRPDWEKDDRQTRSFYSDLLQRFGDDARALNWGSRESQAIRFCVLSEVGNLNDRSILDVGCGLGDMRVWLQQRGIRANYTGIDVSIEMITRARALQPDARFEVATASAPSYPEPGKFDYVLASGIFYLRKIDPEAFLVHSVERMFDACRKGIAFNSLSLWAPNRDLNEYYADPMKVLDACRRISPWVTLRHDYHPRDFTIYLYRDRPRQ